jgi:hypothetical protein
MEQSQIIDAFPETSNFETSTLAPAIDTITEPSARISRNEPEVSRVDHEPTEVILPKKTAAATGRPKRKASLGVSKALLDDEYDSPSSYRANARRQGVAGSAKGSRTSKARAGAVFMPETAYVSTAAPVEILPDIFEDVMEILSKSDKNVQFSH